MIPESVLMAGLGLVGNVGLVEEGGEAELVAGPRGHQVVRQTSLKKYFFIYFIFIDVEA